MFVHLRLTFIYIRVHFNFAIIYDSPIVLIYVCMFYVKYIETALRCILIDLWPTWTRSSFCYYVLPFTWNQRQTNVHQIYQNTFFPNTLYTFSNRIYILTPSLMWTVVLYISHCSKTLERRSLNGFKWWHNLVYICDRRCWCSLIVVNFQDAF